MMTDATTTSSISEHRLSGNWEPSKYKFVDCFDNSEISSIHGLSVVDPLDREIMRKIRESGFEIDRCTHCGKLLTRGNVFSHENGDYVIFGDTCVNRLEFECSDDLRKEHKANAIYRANIRKAMSKDATLAPLVENLRKIADDEDGLHTTWSVNTAKSLLDYLHRNLGFKSDKHRKFAESLPEIAEKAIDRENRYNEKVEERKRKDAESVWLGDSIGERREFLLTRSKVLEYESRYGLFFIHLCRDENDNMVVYKGSSDLFADKDGNEWGDNTARVVATVKEWDERDGVKSTVISRPKIVEVISS